MAWWQFNGYGVYIWGSYGVALIVIGVESVLLAGRRTRALRLIDDSLLQAESGGSR
ncbi:MAG: heme exporter protein CcmD [Casimicrobiaceae bacterium]